MPLPPTTAIGTVAATTDATTAVTTDIATTATAATDDAVTIAITMPTAATDATATPLAAEMVDLARYPIDDSAGDAGGEFAERCRREYQTNGLCALPDFILPAARRRLAAEVGALLDSAWFCRTSHNAYLDAGDPALPPQHAVNRHEHTRVGSLAYDRIGDGLRRLYMWDPLKDFIGAVLGKPVLYRFADVLGACSVNVFTDRGAHGWHFDESEFSVTLLLQSPREGGAFQYVPRLRGRADERETLGAVLDGGYPGVLELPFTAGTLLIFGGRGTLHRVTEVRGDRARLTPVLCYSETPKQRNSEAVRRMFWGRSGEEVAA